MSAASIRFTVAGFKGCHYLIKADGILKALNKTKPAIYDSMITEYPTKAEYKADLPNLKSKYCTTDEDKTKAEPHVSSPIVWKTDGGNTVFLGGCSDLEAFAEADCPSYKENL